MAVTLAVAATAMVAWAGPAEPGPDAVSAPAGAVASAQPAVARMSPADRVVAGSARQVLDTVGLGGVIDLAGTTPKPCGKPFAGWFTMDAARGVDGQRSMTVTVAAWRAGAGRSRFADLLAMTGSCARVDQARGDDAFRATTAPAPGERTVGAIRLGDVVAIIEAATVRAGSVELTGQGLDAARKLLRGRMQGICLDSSGDGGADFDRRDPYGGRYEGRKVRRELRIPVTSPVSDKDAATLTQQRGEATWAAPAPREFPDLAPLDLVAIGKLPMPVVAPVPVPGQPAPDPLLGLPRLRAPRFVDPAALLPPTDQRPVKDPGPAPDRPTPVGGQARVDIPAADPDGPGCGWAFTGTGPPVIDPTAVAAQARGAEIVALAAQSLRQADWMAATAAWPEQYGRWVILRRAANNWQRYERTKKLAQAALDGARAAYDDSISRWRTGDYPKVRPARPSPSVTPTPSESPTPGLPAPATADPTGGGQP